MVFWMLGLGEYLDKDYVIQNKELLQDKITNNFWLSLVIFGLVYISIVVLSLPFASFMTLAAGFLFGLYYGVLVVVVAATIGATLIFLIAKGSFGQFLRQRAKGLYKIIEKEMNDNAVSYLLFLRLVPLFPFFLVNIVPALFTIKTRTYIWTTAIGILPGSAVYVNIGRSLDKIENPSDLVSSDIVIAIAFLGIFAMIPVIYKKLKPIKKAL